MALWFQKNFERALLSLEGNQRVSLGRHDSIWANNTLESVLPVDLSRLRRTEGKMLLFVSTRLLEITSRYLI
jgi:hypothetical protein